MKKGTLLYLLLLQSFLLFGQVDIVSDTVINTNYPVKLNQCIVTKDGRIACVGEQIQGNTVLGYFLLYNPKSADKEQGIIEKTFGGAGRHSFMSIAEADNGTFYIVGYFDSRLPATGVEGWIVQLDEDGISLLHDQKIGHAGDDRFEKITWLDNGTGIVVGYSASLPEGNVWLHTLESRNKIVNRLPFGGNIVGDIVNLMPIPDKSDMAWICGNTRRKSGVWMQQINYLGTQSAFQEFKNRGKLSQADALVSNRLLLAGDIKNNEENTDVWWLEASGLSKPTNIPKIDSNDTEIPTAVCALSPNKFWMAMRVEPLTKKGRIKNIHNRIQFFRSGKIEISDDNFMSSDYRVGFLKYLPEDKAILAIGTATEGTRINFTKFKNNIPLTAAKGLTKVEISNPRLHGTKQENTLMPGEIVSIKFEVKNTGDADMRADGHIIIKEEHLVQGVTISTKELYLLALLRGMTKTLSIPVRSAKDLEGGMSKIKIIIEEGGKEIASKTFDFKSSSIMGTATAGKEIHFQNPAPTARETRVSESTYKIQAEVLTDNKIKKTSPTIYKGTYKVPDGKGKPVVTEPVLSSGRYRFNFDQDIELDSGRNVIYIEFEGVKSDSVIIFFEPSKPDLHILAIGVPDKDLKYTCKDARDFADSLVKQAGLGFFANVYIDTLVTAEKTTKQQIGNAFGKLRNRYIKENADRRIKPNDYLFIFISSHGVIREEDGKFALVPSDYDADLANNTTIDYKALIDENITRIECKRFIFIDACHSGAGKGKSPSNSELSRQIKIANSSTKGLITFTSCSSDESSYEHTKNGVFTAALLEAFSGKPVKIKNNVELRIDMPQEPSNRLSSGNSWVSVKELTDFLKMRVPSLLSDIDPKQHQTPECLGVNIDENITLFIVK